MVNVAPDRPSIELAAPRSPVMVATARRRTKRQQAAAAVITPDARCTPVLVRAVMVGRARMPRAALEIAAANGDVLGHVALPNTSADFDLQQRFWLIGDPAPGSVVALIAEGGRQVLLPGSRLKAGPAPAQDWSGVVCRMLGWERPQVEDEVPAEFQAVFASDHGTVDGPAFTKAVRRFRFAAVTVPLLFFAVCFPYLFVIPNEIKSGASTLKMLALPVIGGGMMTIWSALCRREVGREAELIEPGTRKLAKEIAFTQSYWTGMRKPAAPWDGPIPRGVS